jgi:hypothetical protein
LLPKVDRLLDKQNKQRGRRPLTAKILQMIQELLDSMMVESKMHWAQNVVKKNAK